MNLMSDIALGLIAIGLFVFCDYSSIRWWEQTGKDGYITWWLLGVAVAGPLGSGFLACWAPDGRGCGFHIRKYRHCGGTRACRPVAERGAIDFLPDDRRRLRTCCHLSHQYGET